MVQYLAKCADSFTACCLDTHTSSVADFVVTIILNLTNNIVFKMLFKM